MSLEAEGELLGLSEMYVQPLAAAVDIKNTKDVNVLRQREFAAMELWDEEFIKDPAGPQTAAIRQELYDIQARIYNLEHPTPNGYKPLELSQRSEPRASTTKEISIADFWRKAVSETRTQLFSAKIVSAFVKAERKRQRGDGLPFTNPR
jgi:hypothetical protein